MRSATRGGCLGSWAGLSLPSVCLSALVVWGLIPSAASSDVADPAPTRVFLWEVTPPSSAPAAADPSPEETEGSAGTLYILGATHVGRSAIEGFDPVIESAFERSEALAVEADLVATEDPGFQRFLMDVGQIQDGSKLEQWISPEVRQSLERALTERGMRSDAFEHFEPWLVALMLSGDALSRFGYLPTYGMGRYFVERGRSRPIVELEGARPQIEALDRMEPDVQQVMLQEALDGLWNLDARLQQIAALWSAGDAEGLEALLFHASATSPQRERFFEQMYFDRNRGMADRLEDPLRHGQVWFAIVGAGHVVGDQGLPALLAHRGYRVRQLVGTSGVAAQRAP